MKTYQDISNSNHSSRRVSELSSEPTKESKERLAVDVERLARPRGSNDLDEIVVIVEGGNPDLGESIPQRWRELLLPVISSWVHRRENLESLRGDDRHLFDVPSSLLGENERSSWFEDGVESLENRIVGEGNLIEEDEISRLHRLDEGTVVPLEESSGSLDSGDDVPEGLEALLGGRSRRGSNEGFGGEDGLLRVCLGRDVERESHSFEDDPELLKEG